MAPQVKEAVGALSEAIETACGWAIAALLIYAVLFTDVSGNGRLWDAIRGVARDEVAAAAPSSPVSIQSRVVPVRPPDEQRKAQDRMLFVPETPEREITVPVLAANQPRPSAAMTDAPSDGRAGKDWQRHLKGSLRRFTIYGEGEERSSAATPVASVPAAARAAAAPTPSVADAPYRSPVAATDPRPGIGDHVSRVSGGLSDGVRNFSGR